MKLALFALTFALAAPSFAKPAARVLVKSRSPIVALAYAPNGQILASADDAHRVTLTDVSSGQTKQVFGYKEKVVALAFAPDGKLLAVGVGKQIRLLDPKSDLKTAAPKRVLEMKMPVNSTLQFSADGRVLLAVEVDYSTGEGYAVDVWSVASGKLIRRHQTKYTESYAAALAPDGKTFVAPTGVVGAGLFSVATGQKLRDLSGDFPHNTGFYVGDFAFSPDGKHIAGTGGFMESSGNFTVWDARSGKVKWSHIIDDYGIALAWAPDGARVATGTSYDTTYDDPKDLHQPTGTPVWSASGKWQRSLQRVPGKINALAWAPNGKTLATGGKDGVVRLWAVK